MDISFLQQRLTERRNEGRLRSLKQLKDLIDFSSNDYLGYARSEDLHHRFKSNLEVLETISMGSGGSRLLSGNTAYAEDLEESIAKFHGAEAGLLFNSGYDANLGLFSSLLKAGDTVISDELVHASIIDGIRLGKAKRFIFKHNNLDDLQSCLKQAEGTVFIAIESIYSMDGDEAPLVEIIQLAKEYGAHVIVDEAHATGWYGPNGKGMVSAFRLENEVFARVHTFGKGLGVHGAIVLGNYDLRNYLINFSRSFIYSTAAAMHGLVAIKSSYDKLSVDNYSKLIINDIINLFIQLINIELPGRILDSLSPIQSLIVPGNDACRTLALRVQADGYDVRPILSPTVAAGQERIRICLHSFNTETEIRGLISSFKKHLHA